MFLLAKGICKKRKPKQENKRGNNDPTVKGDGYPMQLVKYKIGANQGTPQSQDGKLRIQSKNTVDKQEYGSKDIPKADCNVE